MTQGLDNSRGLARVPRPLNVCTLLPPARPPPLSLRDANHRAAPRPLHLQAPGQGTLPLALGSLSRLPLGAGEASEARVSRTVPAPPALSAALFTLLCAHPLRSHLRVCLGRSLSPERRCTPGPVPCRIPRLEQRRNTATMLSE